MKRALVVGAGGLGCPAALVLARAGVEAIGFIDDDAVERSNLHRQILHRDADAGRPKARSAADAIARLAPRVRAIAVEARLGADNAAELLAGWDVVLDGSDNFATKFLVNDACVLLGIPFVHAAAIRWGGQLLAVPRGGACYRCLFEEPPPPEAGASCREAGVAGPAVGVVGALAGEAALALLDGKFDPGTGELVIFDGLAGSLRRVRFGKNRECAVCARRIARLDAAAYEVRAC